MRNLKCCHLLWICLALGFHSIPAEAITIGLQPAATTVDVGDTLTLDVVISGLDSAGEIVSAFDLDVTFDQTMLQATGVAFSDFLGDPTSFEALADAVLIPGRIDFWEISLLSDSDLLSRQPGSFALATLSFQAVGVGTTSLLFDPITAPGIDVKGLSANRLDLDASGASITVTGQPNPIAEPSTIWLWLLGFCALCLKTASENIKGRSMLLFSVYHGLIKSCRACSKL